MKKVGIITTYKQPNWGSVLQGFALQTSIEKLGFDAYLIDYKYPNQYHWDRGCKWGISQKRPIKRIIAERLGLRKKPQMQVLLKFINKYCNQTKSYQTREEIRNFPPDFDIYVTGSDQVWNPSTMYGDTTYMLDFVNNGKVKISYSSSFACNNIPEEMRDEYKKWLTQYASISVREKNGVSIIKNLIERESYLVLDPTLLLNRYEWSHFAKSSSKLKLPSNYILFYMLGYTYSPYRKMLELISYLQNIFKMPIVPLNSIPSEFDGMVYNLPANKDVGIPEFLYLIQHASILATSSFHGTAFAVNFGIPFISLYDVKDDRIPTLLNEVGLRKNGITVDTILSKDTIDPYYDSEEEQLLLAERRKRSLSFLKKSLSS